MYELLVLQWSLPKWHQPPQNNFILLCETNISSCVLKYHMTIVFLMLYFFDLFPSKERSARQVPDSSGILDDVRSKYFSRPNPHIYKDSQVTVITWDFIDAHCKHSWEGKCFWKCLQWQTKADMHMHICKHICAQHVCTKLLYSYN